MKLLWREVKHCFNKTSILVLCLMMLIGVLHSLIYLNLQYRTVTPNGELIEGLPAFRVYSEISKDLDGVLDDEYLQKLKKEYSRSYERMFLAEIDKGFLSTGGMMKYIKTNYLLNFPRLGINSGNGNENMDLCYDYLETADTFYAKYKETLYEALLTGRKWSGFREFTEKEKQILRKRIEQMKTPFQIKDMWPIANTKSYLHREFFIMVFMLCFSLSSMFTKDGINKVSDTALVSLYGRNRYIAVKFLSGLIFTVVFAFAQILVVYLVQGIIQGFEGWNGSVQVIDCFCLLNIKIGAGFLLWCSGMLCGLLVVSGMTMMVSMLVKRVRVAIIVTSTVLYFIMKISGGYAKWRILSPFHFTSFDIINDLHPLFGTLVPYIVVVLLLTAVYLIFSYFMVFFLGRRYRWNC